MRTRRATRLALLVLGLLAAATSASAEDGIDWRTDLEAAREEAARTNRPLLIVFR